VYAKRESFTSVLEAVLPCERLSHLSRLSPRVILGLQGAAPPLERNHTFTGTRKRLDDTLDDVMGSQLVR